ncbi:MAG: phosphoglycerate dehydrogenase [Planctomycetota bacterium]|nr:MAG: phosphoglycerate dehydrogenase [Planctomycetota bacterium]
MYRVLITDNLAPAGLELLKAAPDIDVVERPGLKGADLIAALQESDGIIIRSGTKLTADVLEGQRRLRAIVRAGVGVDNIDLAAATRQGIIVMNTPAGNTISTAEHTLAMMLALSRNIVPAAESLKAGRWERKKFTGTQLAGKTLGVIGLGRIGMAVAQRARGLDMNVVGYDPFLSEERAREAGISLFRDLDEMLPRCDFLTVHTHLNDETRGMIGAERIARMKPGARIINCARGGIVDEQAVYDALQSGHLAGAAFDVFVNEPPGEHPLLSCPNFLGTPHLGASTEEAQELVAVEAAEIMIGYLTRGEIRYAVNMIPVSGEEMAALRQFLNLGYRLGLLASQLSGGRGLRAARLRYRGDVAKRNTRLISSAFVTGLLTAALEDNVNIVNAEMLAQQRGIHVEETKSTDTGDFSSLVTATVETDADTITVAGTLFGNEFLRLVRLGPFHLDAYLDGLLLIYRHRDVPGLIGYIGSVLGKHQVNIAHMALGRERSEPGGDAVAVLNLDNRPSEEALAEIRKHPEVTGVQLAELPPAGAPMPWG